MSSSTSRSRGLSRLVAPAPAQELTDDLWVKRRAAVGDAPHGVDEAVQVGDTILQQVPEAFGAASEEFHRVGLLEGALATARIASLNVCRR